jgi:hypothetical protein
MDAFKVPHGYCSVIVNSLGALQGVAAREMTIALDSDGELHFSLMPRSRN